MSTTDPIHAERIARTTAMRVERLLPKSRELLEKHAPQTHANAWLVTEAQVAAIIDDVSQELRRAHNDEMREAERDARDAFREGKYEGQQEARGNDHY